MTKSSKRISVEASFCLRRIFLFMLITTLGFNSKAQGLSFEIKESPDINFLFNTIQKYQSGIVVMNAVTLRIIANGVNWNLYTGAITDIPGMWNEVNILACRYDTVL